MLLAAQLFVLSLGHAEITRIVIDKRTPLHDKGSGRSTSQYEEIRGRLFGEVIPKSASNALIQDIELAPVNKRGNVEYISTFTLFRPVDPAKNSRVLLDLIPNRGNRDIVSSVDGKADPAYYDRGYSMVWIGWQGDLPEEPSAQTSAEHLAMESIRVPRARHKDGSPVLGRYLIRVPTLGDAGPKGALMKLDQGRAGALAYFPASYDTHRATLTGGPAEDVTGTPKGKRYPIKPEDWSWWNCAKNASPDTATIPADLCVKRLRGEFSAAETYLLVFTARDPLVLSLGMAATRDAISFFRYARAGSTAKNNPLSGQIDYVVSQGQSQVGNLVKTFIALGFNQDERGRIVWDGANAHIAGRRTPINYRFATPGSSATLFMPGSEGILWWGKAADALRGGPAGSLLDRCEISHTCPKVFETLGGAELWNQRMTPGMVNFDLKSDIALPDNVRRYYFPGTQHGGGRGGFATRGTNAAGDSSGPITCTLQLNPNPEKDQMRALTVALIDWVSSGKPPPASRYPLLANGELVRDSVGSYTFPSIPGAPKPFGLANPVIVYDYGRQFDSVDMSGVILKQPPDIKGVVPALVAQVDADGNETSGVPSVQHLAPLGTYLSWNTYKEGPYAGQICSYFAGFVPFSRTPPERLASGDPRRSIEERYGNRQGYVCAVQNAAWKSVKERFLLKEDAQRLIAEATAATSSGDLSFLPTVATARGRALCASVP